MANNTGTNVLIGVGIVGALTTIYLIFHHRANKAPGGNLDPTKPVPTGVKTTAQIAQDKINYVLTSGNAGPVESRRTIKENNWTADHIRQFIWAWVVSEYPAASSLNYNNFTYPAIDSIAGTGASSNQNGNNGGGSDNMWDEAAGGAAAGAAIGSAVPIVGTVAGAIVGGSTGFIKDIFNW